MRKPTLLGVEGQAQEIIEMYHAGLCFEPENKESFLDNLYALKNDESLYQHLQNGCDHLAKAYDRDQLASQMLSILLNLKP